MSKLDLHVDASSTPGRDECHDVALVFKHAVVPVSYTYFSVMKELVAMFAQFQHALTEVLSGMDWA